MAGRKNEKNKVDVKVDWTDYLKATGVLGITAVVASVLGTFIANATGSFSAVVAFILGVVMIAGGGFLYMKVAGNEIPEMIAVGLGLAGLNLLVGSIMSMFGISF